jgi:hypothetical protein
MRPVTLTCAALPVMTSALGAADVSRPEKSFYFPWYAFLFYLQYSKKKIQILNFEFENSKI